MERPSRYVVLEPIARGAVADLLLGIAVSPNGRMNKVLIKRLRTTQDVDDIRSFLDEAYLLERLHHPNIVPLVDSGVADGQAFVVLEYIDGTSLATLIAKAEEAGETFSVPVAFFIVEQIARALDYAHGHNEIGLVHRDVTPHNILIARDGRVLLTDFGIALFRDRSMVTRAGYVRGKLPYMAPEQLQASDVDARADIFSLGCVLHELLGRRSPFATAEAREKLLLGEAVELAPSIPKTARPIIESAISGDRRRRFQTAAELRDACVSALADAAAARFELGAWVSGVLDEAAPTEVKTWSTPLFAELSSTGTPDRTFVSGKPNEQTASEVVSFLSEWSVTAPPASVPPTTSSVPKRTRSRRSIWQNKPALAGIFGAQLLLVGVLALLLDRNAAREGEHEPAVSPVVVVETRPVEHQPEPEPEPEPTDLTAKPKRRKKRRTVKPREPEIAAAPEPVQEPQQTPEDPPAEVVEPSKLLKDLAGQLRRAKDRLPPEKLREFETAYFDLSLAEADAKSSQDRAKIARNVRKLMAEIDAAALNN